MLIQKQTNRYVNFLKKSGIIIAKLFIGSAALGLVAYVGLTLILFSSLHSITDLLSKQDTIFRPHIYAIPPQPSVQKTEPIAPPPDDPAPALKKPKPELAKSDFSGTNIKTAEPIEPEPVEILEDPMEGARNARTEEIEELKEALPDNIIIPFERSQAEAEALIEKMEEQMELQQLINEDLANYSDKERYFELLAKPIEDEIELISYCSGQDDNNGFCRDIIENGNARIEELEKTMEKLQRELL